jgi:2-amino-4-hydroxy-6-hydroxymethyldihydropteridine diphosphokinase
MARCLIGCGSNQGARREQLDRAIELLGVMPGIRLAAVSRHRETRPVGGPPDQPPFLNGACLVETELAPHELLGTLTAVENTLHRDRSERWGPRTVDLDLLLYDEAVIDDEVIDGAALTVPHPRMTTRRFVLEPAVEIAPDLPHPLAGCTIRDLLENISQPHLHVAVVGVPGSGAAEVAGAIADATLARIVHAPAALPWHPGQPADVAGWIGAFEACARPLRSESWPDDPHGTVADYWLGAYLTAAVDCLPAAALARVAADHARVMAGTVPPNIVILLRASTAALSERIAFQAGHERFSNLYSELGTGDWHGDVGAALSRLQDRLIGELHCRQRTSTTLPKSVVVVDADDLARAVDEAIAAVEAVA